jgi:hypothetical protein
MVLSPEAPVHIGEDRLVFKVDCREYSTGDLQLVSHGWAIIMLIFISF